MPLPPHADDIREALTEAGQRLADARRAQQDAMLDIGHWLRTGDEHSTAPLDITEMADLAGISRPTAYKLLKAPPVEIEFRP